MPGAAPVLVEGALDVDAVGRAAPARVWEHLTDTEAGTARAAELPDGLDPARLLEVDPGALRQALAATRPFTHLAIDTVRHAAPAGWSQHDDRAT